MKTKKIGHIKGHVQFKILTTVFLIACATIFLNNVYTQITVDKLATEVRAEVPNVKLSVKDYAWEQAKKAGLDPVHLVMIIEKESNWDSEAIGVNNNKTYDLGIAQWNSIHKIPLQDKLDPYKSIDMMIAYRLKTGNYHAWVAAQKLGIIK